MDTTTIPLSRPIKRGSGDLAKLTLREPSTGDLRGLKLTDLLQMDTAALLTVLTRITAEGLTGPEAASLSPADLVRAGGAVVGFFAPSETPTASPTT